jgi:hypothetical protein
MPMTWAQVWTMFQNVAIQALDPVLDAISWLANNIDLVGPIVLGLGAAFGVFLLAANWTNICTAATTALTTAQEMLRAVMATTWGLPLIIIALVIGAIYAVTAAVNHFAGTSVSATGIIAGAVLTVAAIIGNTVIGLLNGIIQAVWSIFVTPFLGIIITRPSSSNFLIASRIGVRLTPSLLASCISISLSPGSISPVRIACLNVLNTTSLNGRYSFTSIFNSPFIV